MATYTWTINNLEYNAADGGITTVHWGCVGTEEDVSIHNYGTCSFSPDATSEGFIDYQDLTQETVLAWVYSVIDKDQIEASMAEKITAKLNPVTLTGMPWVVVSEEVVAEEE